MQMPRRVSLRWWHVARFVSLAASAVILVLLIAEPKTGLKVFWRFVIPLLPLLFFVAPGFWRNICPLAAMNQTPRYLGFTPSMVSNDCPLRRWPLLSTLAAT